MTKIKLGQFLSVHQLYLTGGSIFKLLIKLQINRQIVVNIFSI